MTEADRSPCTTVASSCKQPSRSRFRQRRLIAGTTGRILKPGAQVVCLCIPDSGRRNVIVIGSPGPGAPSPRSRANLASGRGRPTREAESAAAHHTEGTSQCPPERRAVGQGPGFRGAAGVSPSPGGISIS